MGCPKIAEHFSVGKQLFRTFWEKVRTYERTSSFSKVTIKSVVMESTTLSMKICTIGMEIARVQTYILMGPLFKKKLLWRSKEGWTKKNLLVLQLFMQKYSAFPIFTKSRICVVGMYHASKNSIDISGNKFFSGWVFPSTQCAWFWIYTELRFLCGICSKGVSVCYPCIWHEFMSPFSKLFDLLSIEKRIVLCFIKSLPHTWQKMVHVSKRQFNYLS